MEIDIDAALHKLSVFATLESPPPLSPGAGMEQAMQYVEFLTSFAARCDAVVLACGQEIDRAFGLHDGDLLRYFSAEVFGALDGNALYLIEESARDEAADRKRQSNRDQQYEINRKSGV